MVECIIEIDQKGSQTDVNSVKINKIAAINSVITTIVIKWKDNQTTAILNHNNQLIIKCGRNDIIKLIENSIMQWTATQTIISDIADLNYHIGIGRAPGGYG